ncbi:MAG: Gfo/Idh/MocA family oxidoreductase [Deltaproteobacteria bacterium]|nr:MAG: Gfo/Idh/MocA family oxidoreductase [Deltaproteobacteria bacterium]
MIRIAVVGAGQWGPNLIRNFHNRRTSEVAWVVDRDAGRLDQVRERFPDIQLATDPETVMADGRTDAVVIATPTSTHYALARRALAGGKHVLVEKPITADSTEAEELCSLASGAGRVLMVGHVFVYNPGVQRVRQLLAAGELGRVYYVSMVRTNLGPIRVDVNAAWDLASHDVSVANYWLGSAPLAASAVGGSWINPGVEDAVFATLRYPNDVLVNLHISWLSPRKTREITLVGDRRMLTFDDMNLSEPVRVYDKQVTEVRTPAPYIDSFASFRASLREGDITIPKVALGEPLKAECDHFVECIVDGKPPLTGGREAATVVRALEAVQRSMRAAGREEPV